MEEKPGRPTETIHGAKKITLDEAQSMLGKEALEEGVELLEKRRLERLKKMGVELPKGVTASERRIDLGDKHGILVYVGRPGRENQTSAEDTTMVYFIPDEKEGR